MKLGENLLYCIVRENAIMYRTPLAEELGAICSERIEIALLDDHHDRQQGRHGISVAARALCPTHVIDIHTS